MLLQERVAKMRREEKVDVASSAANAGGNAHLNPTAATTKTSSFAASSPPLLAPPPSSNVHHNQRRRSRSRSRRPPSPVVATASLPSTTGVTPTKRNMTTSAIVVTPESSPTQTSRPSVAQQSHKQQQQKLEFSASFQESSNQKTHSHDLEWPAPLSSSSSLVVDHRVISPLAIPAAATTSLSASATQRIQQQRRHHQHRSQRTAPSQNHHHESLDSTCSIIPESYILLIQKAFGQQDQQSDDHSDVPDIDLYRDVLQVDRFTASAKDIRIAYFRRGRQVLASSAVANTTPTTNSNSNDASSISSTCERTKLQFQAVSMAYEILSNPTWKRYYDEHGLTATIITAPPPRSNHSIHSHASSNTSSISQHSNLTEESIMLESLQQQLMAVNANSGTPKSSNRTTMTMTTSTRSGASGYSSDSGTLGSTTRASAAAADSPDSFKRHGKTQKKKRSSSASHRRRSRSVGVRWHDYVEELVFEKEKGGEQARLERRRRAKLAKLQQDVDHEIDVDDNILEDEEEKKDDKAAGRTGDNNKDKKKRKKHRVMVEPSDDTDDLSNHLNKLNRETGSFVVGLLDQLESGIDQLISLDDDDYANELDDFDKMLLAKRKLAYRKTPSKDEDDDELMNHAAAMARSQFSLERVPMSVRRRSVSDFAKTSTTSPPILYTTEQGVTTSATAVVTDFLQKVTASFDDFMLMEGPTMEETKQVDAIHNRNVKETRRNSPPTSALRSNNNNVSPSVEAPQDDVVQTHSNNEIMTDPLTEWLQPNMTFASSPEPAVKPASRSRRKRASLRQVQPRSATSSSPIAAAADDRRTPKLVSGPVAECGRENDYYDESLPSQASLQPIIQKQSQQFLEDSSLPLRSRPSMEQQQQPINMEHYSLDDGSSLPPPPVQEVRKVQRHAKPHSRYHHQHHDDDMSSLSESFAAYMWSDPTQSCWTMYPLMSDENSFQAAPPRLLSAAAPTTTINPTQPTQDAALVPASTTTVAATPSSPRATLPSILKTPKFQPTSPQPPVNLNADGFNPTNPFNDLDDYDDDPSSRGGGYSTPSNSIVSGSEVHSNSNSTTNNNNLLHNSMNLFPNIRITIHNDNDYGIPCFDGCHNGHYEDARLGGQAFLRSLTKYMEEMSHDLAAACGRGGNNTKSLSGNDDDTNNSTVGCPQSAKAMMQSLMISDQDLEGLLTVLRCEMDRHQVVPKHQTQSQQSKAARL